MAESPNSDALHLAAEDGNLERVQSLLSASVDPNVRTGEQGETALMYAAGSGCVEVIRVLVAAGAVVNAKTTQESWTALHAACVAKDRDAVELLLSLGADPNVYSFHRSFDEERLGWSFVGTPLHVVAANGCVEVAELLVSKRASVNAAWSADRRTPLFHAAAYGHAALIELLCMHGADPNSREHRHAYENFFDKTPLHYAAENGHVDAVTMLLFHKAEPRAVESYSRQTAVQMARAAKHKEVVKLLTERLKRR